MPDDDLKTLLVDLSDQVAGLRGDLTTLLTQSRTNSLNPATRVMPDARVVALSNYVESDLTFTTAADGRVLPPRTRVLDGCGVTWPVFDNYTRFIIEAEVYLEAIRCPIRDVRVFVQCGVAGPEMVFIGPRLRTGVFLRTPALIRAGYGLYLRAELPPGVDSAEIILSGLWGRMVR